VFERLAHFLALLLGIFLKGDRRHIGNIKMGPVNWRYGRADVGLVIGDKSCWGNGYATGAISGICEFAFTTLGLRRLEAGAYSSNVGSIKAFLKARFVQEGILRGRWTLDGQAENHVIVGRLAEEF
jgi:ribosomal-protein-alanine N-acetyltransferase